MADRYQGRPFPADDDRNRRNDMRMDMRADIRAPAKADGDPLAELARLIGQTDPFAGTGRGNPPMQPQVQPRAAALRDPYQPPATADPDDGPAAGPPQWMQRANRQEIPNNRQQEAPMRQEVPSREYPQLDHPSPVPPPAHPLHRYAAPHAPEPNYREAPPFAESEPEPDPSRYDEALYGQLDTSAQEPQYDQDGYAEDDPYGYQDGYGDGADEEPVRKRGGGMMTVAIVLALAVVGTGAAFAYRTYVGSPRSGEPPIIRADAGPTKIMPLPSDAMGKLPDRLAPGDGAERIVPREEAPVDVNANANARSAPRVVFPPLNQNANPPPASSVASNALPPTSAGNGTLSSSEPRKIRTLSVRGDQPDAAATPVTSTPATKPAPTTRSLANANASSNAPMPITPQAAQQAASQPAPAAEPRARVAATNPDQTASTAGAGGGHMVQVSSQRNEADAQTSFKALQGKFPAVMGSREPVIRRADLGEKGVYYRAMVGPFASSDEAAQFCTSLRSAGGQCVIPRN